MIEWPFTGRADELRHLYRLVADGGGRGVVVAGAAGVGKTRLAVECLRLAERAGIATLRATATRSAASLPFGAVAGLLPAPGERSGAVDDRAWLLRCAATGLVERFPGRRLVVLIDDAHLLDAASATLVHQLAATRAAVVLATIRTDEPAPDPVVALWKDDLVERVELGTLSREAVAELLAAALNGPVDPATLTQLAARAEGNVLFLTELVLGALDTGALVEDDGAWHLTGPLLPSHRLIELVETRLEDVDLAERAVLELVAFGEPLGETELSRLVDAARAEALERRGLLDSRMNGRRLELRLAHPLYGEVLRARVPEVRRRAIARALAEAVEATGARRRDDTLRVASWRLIGGGGRPDVLLAGATEARWRYDFPLAERMARAALDAGAGFDAALLAAQLASLQGRTGDAERELAALAECATDDAQRGQVARARIHNSVLWTGRDGLRIVDEAERSITDPAWRDELAAERLNLLVYTSGPREVAEAARPLLARARDGALVFASITAGYSLSRAGRTDEALEAAARGHAVHMATTTPLAWYPWWHTFTRCMALSYAGRLQESEALARANYEQALAEGSLEAQAVFGVLPAYDVGERGRVRTAARRALRALRINEQLDRPLLSRFCLTYRALALALAGQPEEARRALAAVDDLVLPPSPHHEADLIQARAWTAAAAGNLPEARRHLRRAAQVGDECGDLVGRSAALHGMARLGRAREVHDELAEVAVHIDGDLAPARAAHAAALAQQDAEALEAVSRAFEAMGADLLAAEAAADAAVAQRRAGRLRAAVADENRAHAVAERCEGPATPALQPVATRAGLTAAEREAALLAAAGLANRAIAEQLFLSVRTVENRLQRVYEKLGITRRTQLADVLGTPAGASPSAATPDQGLRPMAP